MKKLREKFKVPSSFCREEGVALVIALLVMVMLTVVGLVAIISSSTETSIAVNARGSTQALFLAEAGVSQVAWWFKSPTTFTIAGHFPNGYGATAQDFFAPRLQGGGSYFTDTSNTNSQFTGTYDIPDFRLDARSDLDGNVADQFLNTNGDAIFANLQAYGKITELRVYGPTAQSGNICRVRVTAVSKTGGSRTIEQDLGPNPFAGLVAPLQSGIQASWHGNGTIHWGDVIVQGNSDLQNNPAQIPLRYNKAGLTDQTRDRWFNARITGTFTGQETNPSTTPYSNICVNEIDGQTLCHTNLIQRQTNLQLQTWNYQTMKNIAIQKNSYYVYEGGTICQGGLCSQGGTPIALDTLLTRNGGYVFVDNPEQRDPTGGGTTNFTISQSGNPGGVINGVFYIAGNLSLNPGGGTDLNNVKAPPNPNDLPDCTGQAGCATPNQRDTTTLSQINVKGVLYTTGLLDLGGQVKMFGAAVAQGGYTSGGTPDIYYDWDVRNGNIGNMSPTVSRTWHEIRTD